QEYLIAFPWAPWTDLLRVDVLNCIGVSLVLVSLVLFVSKTWTRMALNAAFASAVIIMLSPLVWTHRFTQLPWFIASYLNGVHNQGKPLPWLFPIFPWAAFAFAGVVVACILQSQKAKSLQSLRIPLIAAGGVLVAALGYGFDHLSVSVFPAAMYDFWHTSSGFFLIRVGVLLLILALSDLRCRIPSVISKSKALVLLGQHSLLVYWVHIEFVYGRLHVLPRHGMSVSGASLGLAGITLAMLLLAYARSKWPLSLKGLQRSRATAAG
ncbi:MAG TPA: acyltransferase family protein, partial [Candidatus Angelobacter sp.]|nr:acyltransferase family protein [Candidatus Angelobacter sp.]